MKSKKRRGGKKQNTAGEVVMLPFKILRTFFWLISRRWFRYTLFSLISVGAISIGAERLLRGAGLVSDGRAEVLKRVVPVTAAVWAALLAGAAVVRRSGRLTIKKLDMMEGHEFEYACAGLLRANGFKNVEVTKGSGDFGVDIIAFKKRRKYAVQCKHYDKKLGNSAIQEVIGGLAVYGCTDGAVMTNSYFTEPARRLAEANGIELWDREVLAAMLDRRGTRKAVQSSVSADDETIDPEAVCAKTVEDFFKTKDIPAEVVNAGISEDNSRLLVEIVPGAGVRIRDIKSLTDELAAYGGWERVDCVFPSKTAGTMGLEIPLSVGGTDG